MSFKNSFTLLIVVGLCALCASAAPAQTKGLVVGYVFPQNLELQPGEIDAKKLSRVNYAFANIADGRMVTGFEKDAENFAYLNGLKHDNPSLKVLVSVGGWLWSTNFSDVSLNVKSRQVFIDSVMEFLTKFKLDGLDIDWEYPGMVGSGHPFRPEDKENFTILLKELRTRFDHDTSKAGHRFYLTIASGGSDEYLSHTEMDKVQRYVDTVNLMAYDYYEPSSDKITGNHAPLYTDPADPKKVSADASVKAFEKAGVPAAKIVLGVPFYGHTWGKVADHGNGLFQPGQEIPNAYSNYGVISKSMLNNGFTRYWDKAASVPYLYSAEKQTFVSYEDPESLGDKCKYVRSQGLSGIMFWDYSGDPSGVLLEAVHAGLAGAKSKAISSEGGKAE